MPPQARAVSPPRRRHASPPKKLSELPDSTLTDLARLGDDPAFAELWRRHSAAGLAAARHFTSVAAPDDLVSEAYLRILAAIRRGSGPTEAFRTYLYRTIRTVAIRWAETQSAPAASIDDDFDIADPGAQFEDAALDRTLLAQAFKSLPRRWQEALWHLEVEQMTPPEVAVILGIAPNAVSALGVRAREGLRRAWLQAHVSERDVPDACRWAITHAGAYTRGGLTRRNSSRVDEHLASCARCSTIVGEVRKLDLNIAAALLPVFLGSAAAAAMLASRDERAADPSSVSQVAWGAGGSVAAGGGFPVVLAVSGVAAATVAIVAVVALSGTGSDTSTPVAQPPQPIVPAIEAPPADEPDEVVDEPEEGGGSGEVVTAPQPTGATNPPPKADNPPADTTAPGVPTVVSTFPGVTDWLPTVSGTGEAGATVTITDGNGTVLATATVAGDGSWSAQLADPRAEVVTLKVTQKDAAGNVSAEAVLDDAITFRVPAVVVVDEPEYDIARIFITSELLPGWQVETTVDSDAATLDADGSTVEYIISRTAVAITLRYHDPVTGAYGATIVAAGPGA